MLSPRGGGQQGRKEHLQGRGARAGAGGGRSPPGKLPGAEKALTEERDPVPDQGGQLAEEADGRDRRRRGRERQSERQRGKEPCTGGCRGAGGSSRFCPRPGNEGLRVGSEALPGPGGEAEGRKSEARGIGAGRGLQVRSEGPGVRGWPRRACPSTEADIGVTPPGRGAPLHIPGDHLLLLVGRVAPAAQHLGWRGQEVEAVVVEVLVDEGQQDLGGQGSGVSGGVTPTPTGSPEQRGLPSPGCAHWGWRGGATPARESHSLRIQPPPGSWAPTPAADRQTDLGKELDLLLVGGLLHPPTAHHGLWGETGTNHVGTRPKHSPPPPRTAPGQPPPCQESGLPTPLSVPLGPAALLELGWGHRLWAPSSAWPRWAQLPCPCQGSAGFPPPGVGGPVPRWAMNSCEMSIHLSSCCKKP